MYIRALRDEVLIDFIKWFRKETNARLSCEIVLFVYCCLLFLSVFLELYWL